MRALGSVGRAAFAVFASTVLHAAGPDEIILTVNVNASGKAAVGSVLSDQCEAHLTGRLVFKPDPVSGRYGEPSQETYTFTASGGGHVLDIETWSYEAVSPSPGTVSLNYMPSQGKARIGWKYLDDMIRSAPEGSERMARTFIKMAEDDYEMNPDSGLVTFEPNAASFTTSGGGAGEYSSTLGSGDFTAQYTLSRGGDAVEAVMFTPRDYDAWIPEGGPYEFTPGITPIEVRAELRIPGTTAPPPVRKARFRFELIEVSREPGTCLNWPSKEEAKDDFDLGFADPSGLTPVNVNQTYETERLTTEAIAVVLSYDYGAYGRVRVTAILDTGEELVAYLEGKPEQTTLTLPKDENDNRIADVWERSEGTWGKVQDPAWDESDIPKDHEVNGDGISLYEKYRGFRFGATHERLDAWRKHVFIYDPDNLVHANLGSVMSFAEASSLRVRFVESDAWTGSGPVGSGKRIVNFNTSGFGHAVDQHGLHVRVVHAKSPALAADFQQMWQAKYGAPLSRDISSCYGFAYHDVTGGAWPESPRSAFAIELYPSGIEAISREYVRYHTMGLPLFQGYASATPEEQAWLESEWKRLADEYIFSHPFDWAEQNYLYLMAGISHEVGHGVGLDDLKPPHTGGPWTCFMRYLDWDMPRNLNDRMELVARWRNELNRPQRFCHDATATVPGKGCYEQIHVTDRTGAGNALHRAQAELAASPGPAPAADPPAANPAGSRRVSGSRSAIALAGTPASPLGIESELVWGAPWAGDPLRVVVRLKSPSASSRWTQALLEGRTAAPVFPEVAPAWPAGLRLALFRLTADGTRSLVLGEAQTRDYMRTPPADPASYDNRFGVRSREILLDPQAAPLEPGDYVLTTRWEGREFAATELLPPDGVVVGAELRFQVAEPTTAEARSSRLRRRAFQSWDAGRFEEARSLGAEAAGLTPDAADAEAVDTVFVMALASLHLEDLAGAVRMLRTLEARTDGRVSSEAQGQARWAAGALVPSVQIRRNAAAGSPAVIEVLGHTGQRYELQGSVDLANWESLDQRVTVAARYTVEDPAIAAGRSPRFYRVVWLP